MGNLGPNFYPKLVQIASETGMKPEDILAIMVSESGINPQAHNPHGGAAGLVQFMPSTLRGIGFQGSTEDMLKLSGEEQLIYVKNLIQANMRINGGPFTSAAQYYTSVFWPAALKLPGIKQGDPKTPFLEESPEIAQDPHTGKAYSKKYYDIGMKINPDYEAIAYRSNPAFHGSTPGAITYGDMINQVEKNKRNPLYRKALLAMKDQTGYQPGSMLAQKESPSMPIKTPSTFMEILDQFVQSLSIVAATKPSKQLYKRMLPSHDILIRVSAPDYTSAVEFSRVLCAALEEELQADSYPHTDGSQSVEIECSIPGPDEACFAAVQQLSGAVANAFKSATTKIGGITVQTNCLMNKKSCYQEISPRTADTNYRKFLLKFI